MPAAAVIPAPIAYIKVVAVKKLVVDCRTRTAGLAAWSALAGPSLMSWGGSVLFSECRPPEPRRLL